MQNARGLVGKPHYHRWGLTPRPENIFIIYIIVSGVHFVNRLMKIFQSKKIMHNFNIVNLFKTTKYFADIRSILFLTIKLDII